MSRKSLLLIAVLLLCATAVYAVGGTPLHQNSFFFSYNPEKTIDRSKFGFTNDDVAKGATKFDGMDLTKLDFAAPSVNTMTVKYSVETGTTATIAPPSPNELKIFGKVLSPNQVNITIYGTDLVPEPDSKVQTHFKVSYDIGQLTELKEPGNTSPSANPPAVVADIGTAGKPKETSVYVISIPSLGSGRTNLGYWFWAPITITVNNFEVPDVGNWSGSMKVKVEIM